ncbi:MAG: cell division protein FtsZ [Pararhodobacter sp.]
MALTFIESEKKELTPRITVFGVGGAGGNAVNNMIDQQLAGVEFVVANTDAQALQQSRAPARIQLGVKVTEGLGAGARPQVGANAAEETLEDIIDHLAGAHMCFITAGMGGGTGTGAAPIIAQAARELGVLTVGVVTKPFAFEGSKRMRQAEEGVEALQKVVDTLIIIPNQNLFRLANEKTTFTDAFAMADDVLYQGVKGVTDLMVRPGMINLDFADVRAVMDEMGKAMMGTGEAEGEDRARQAAEKAIANPLLDEISLHGARGVLINITGGNDLTLFELDEAANIIRKMVDEDANIIVGSTLDPEMNGKIRVSVVATGIEAQADAVTLEVPRRRIAEPLVPQHLASVSRQEPEAEPAAAAYFDQQPAESHEPEPVAEHYEPAPQHNQQQPAYAAHQATGYEQHQPQRGHDGYPVQDEFDLDAVLDDAGTAPAQPAPVRHAAPQQPQVHHHAHHAAHPQPTQPEWQREAASYVAPRPHDDGTQRGTPTRETLERLRAAVAKQPEQTARPAPRQAAPAQPAERSRFGIGSLISKMAGNGSGEAGHGHGPAQSAQRVQPPVQSYDEDPYQQREAQDRIEIPAFLRRQAN